MALFFILPLLLLQLVISSFRVRRALRYRRAAHLEPIQSAVWLGPEEATLAVWERELEPLAFVRVGDFCEAGVAEGREPNRHELHRVFASADRRVLADAYLPVLDLNGSGDAGSQLRPLSLRLFSGTPGRALVTHNAISRALGDAPPGEDVLRRAGITGAAALVAEHLARLPADAPPIDDPRDFLERRETALRADWQNQGALVPGGPELLAPGIGPFVRMMLANNTPVAAEARSPLASVAWLGVLATLSAVWGLTLLGRPPGAFTAGSFAPFPLLACATAYLFPHSAALAVYVVLAAAFPLWLLRPVETNLACGGSFLAGTVTAIAIMNRRRSRVPASSSTPPWVVRLQVALFITAAVNGVLAWLACQVPVEGAFAEELDRVQLWVGLATLPMALVLVVGSLVPWVQHHTGRRLGLLVFMVLVCSGAGTGMGRAQKLTLLFEAEERGEAAVRAIRRHHQAQGSLPPDLAGLGVPTSTGGILSQPFHYEIVGDPAAGTFRLWFRSPYGRRHHDGFGFGPTPVTASVHVRLPSGRPLP